MSGIIQQLPDHVANQIAAGEVIQRPASAVKELLENAVDAGSKNIQLIIKDGGRSLIQVIDNGSGMTEFDARLCFARHATSKLKNADDLWHLRTMGFRGEALASIAAVAQVEMRTRRKEDETGILIQIEGSEIVLQEPISAPAGTSIAVKNLFYNVPARRNFLKSNPVETRHILEEFYRVALAFPDIAFSLINNGEEVHRLMAGTFKQRIVSLFGNSWNEKLLMVKEEHTSVKVSGFIGKPDAAKKTRGDQYFFINNRFIKNSYLNHAVQAAYMDLMPAGDFPVFFIRFEVDPATIDVNIHPTKTEIKFEDDRTVYGILRSAVKKAIGSYALSPSLDFDTEMPFVSIAGRNTEIKAPHIQVNPDYNPFSNPNPGARNNAPAMQNISKIRWEELAGSPDEKPAQLIPSESDNAEKSMPWLLHGKYVCSQVKSGLMVIDLQGARERIHFERFMHREEHHGASQQLLFPVVKELSGPDTELIRALESELKSLGFDFEYFGKHTIKINGVPAEMLDADAKEIIESILEEFKKSQQDLRLNRLENLAKTLAIQAARHLPKQQSPEQLLKLIERLFACETPGFSPNGKQTISIISLDDLAARFGK